MEVILISDSKVKIMLTEEDLREFAIDCDADERDTDLRRRFKDVLRRADDVYGTDIGTARVMVQLFQSRKGGCELFVTRLSPSLLPLCAPDTAAPSLYIFDSIGALIAVSRLLGERGYGKNSTALCTDGGKYALLLPEFSSEEPLPLSAACLDEYGTRSTDAKMRLYISEHARTLCGNEAVKTLSKF